PMASRISRLVPDTDLPATVMLPLTTLIVLPLGIVIDGPAITHASMFGFAVYGTHSDELDVSIFWVVSVTAADGISTQISANVPTQKAGTLPSRPALSMGATPGPAASTGELVDRVAEKLQPTRASAKAG